MKNAWFRRAGCIYFPSTVQGFLIVAAAVAFCANVFWAIDRTSHSVTDTLYRVYPFFVCTFLLVDWIGRNSSSESK